MEEKDLNFFINQASQLNEIDADNYLRAKGVSGEDYTSAMTRVRDLNPSFYQSVPYVEQANAVFKEDQGFWGSLWDIGLQGKEAQKKFEEMSGIVGQGFVGEEVDAQEVREFMDLNAAAQGQSMTPELERFNERYAERIKEYGGEEEAAWYQDYFAGFKALLDTYHEEGEISRGVIGEIFAQSQGAYFTPQNLTTVAGTTIAGGLAGAFAGSPIPIIGNIGGALGGLYAGFRLGSSVIGGKIEAQAAVAEFVMDELSERGLEYNEENLGTILNDQDAMFNVARRAATRGVTIASVEFITQGLAAGAASRAFSRTASRVGALPAAAVGVGVGLTGEAVGGGLGEIAGSLAAGQDYTASDVIMEAVGGLGTAPVTITKGLLTAPSYRQGGARISSKMAYRLVEESTPQELMSMKLEVKRDDNLSNLFNKKTEPLRQRAAAVRDNQGILVRLSTQDAQDYIETVVELSNKQESKAAKSEIDALQSKLDEIASRAKEQPVSPEATAEAADGNETEANSENVSREEQEANASAKKGASTSEADRLSEYDETEDADDGSIPLDRMPATMIGQLLSQSRDRLKTVNRRISQLATKYQNVVGADGSVGGPSAMSVDERAELKRLKKEQGELERKVAKYNAAERKANKKPRPVFTLDVEEQDDFIELDPKNLTDESMSQVPTEFRNLLNNVLNKAFAKFKDRLPDARIYIHNSLGSLNKAVRGVNGGRAMKIGTATFGWYHNGQIHMLDVTNPQVREQLRTDQGFTGDIDSVINLVTEEVAYHYGMESILSNDTVRGKFISQLVKFVDMSIDLKRILSNRVIDYFPSGVEGIKAAFEGDVALLSRIQSRTLTGQDIKAILDKVPSETPQEKRDKATFEEELLAGFVRSYLNTPNSYRNIWQRIADLINRFVGRNIINTETDLRGFARVMSRALDGDVVDYSPDGSRSPSVKMSRRSKGDFNYLVDTTLYYDFDRQYGVEYVDWADKPPAVPQKITVKDYFHYRNWYNKMTGNQEFPGVITNVHFIKDGKRYDVKPPKPKRDKQGNKVKVDRIKSFGQLRAERAQAARKVEKEIKQQLYELRNETAQLWRDSGMDMYTSLPNFIPPVEDRLTMGSTPRDPAQEFEDLVIQKANLQALIDSGISPEELNELKGDQGVIDPFEHSEIYSMSGLDRVNEDGEPGELIGPNVKFSTSSVGADKISSISEDGKFNGVRIAKPSQLPSTSMSLKYDVAGKGTVRLTYGDNDFIEFEVSGGVEEVQSMVERGLSIAHASESNREGTLGRLKYLDFILTSTEGELKELIQDRVEDEARKLRIAIATQKKRGRNAYQEESRYKELTSGDVLNQELEAVMQTKKQLEADEGKVTVYFHQNKLRSLPARRSVFKGIVDIIFKGVEVENNSEFTKAVIDDLKRSIDSEWTGKRSNRTNLVEEYGKPIDYNSLESVKAFMYWAADREGAFHEKDDFVSGEGGSLRMFLSTRGTGKRPAVFSKYPFISPSAGTQLQPAIDGYYQEVYLSELLKRNTKSGTALAAVVIDLNKLFVGAERKAVRENVEGSDFKYYIGGLDEVVYLDEKVSLDFSDDVPDKTGLSEVIFDDDGNKALVDEIKDQLEKLKNASPSAQSQIRKKLERLEKRLKEAGYAIEANVSSTVLAHVRNKNNVKFSKAATRRSITLTEKAGRKGVSVNQVLQVMGKSSKAEQAVLQDLISKYPGAQFISKEEFEQHLENKMLQPLEEQRSHADYGLDRIYGRKYRRLEATTIPFVGDDSIYGTPGIFEEHFDFPVHAHVRIFSDPNQPGVLYVSELQSDTYQKGLDSAYDGVMTEQGIIENYGSDEVDVSVQNLDFLKYILENYDQYRTLILVAAGGRDNAINPDWWDDVLTKVEIVPENRLDDAPNMGSLLSNALANDPNFNVRAFRVLLRQYALSNLKAPINSTEKQIDQIINDHFNKYPYVQPGEKNNLGNFSKDLVISIDYMADTVSDIALGEELIDMSPEDRMKVYDGAVQAVERYRNRDKEEKKEGISSAKKSWEKQTIRHIIKRAQENGDRVVRFPTEKTAADIQWWDASDVELSEYMSEEFGVDRMFGGEMGGEILAEEKERQIPLRRRYRSLPKTLRSIGLESTLVRDEIGNSWYEVDTPPIDMRMAMFSKANNRNNFGDLGGATWQMREQSAAEDFTDVWLTRLQDKYRRVFKLQEDVAASQGGQVRREQDFRMAEELLYGKAANDLEGLDRSTQRITDSLKKNGLTVDDLDQYMYALHAQERNAVIRERTDGKNQMGSGISDLDAQAMLNAIPDARKRQLEESAAIVRGILQDTRDSMVELGLESQETIDAFEQMFENYVPLQGKSVDEADMAYSPYPNGGTGFSVSGSTTKKAKGRFTESSNIVAQAISQNAAVKIKGRTNEAINSLYRLAEANPNPNVWQVLDKEADGYKSDDPNIVSVRVNGVQKAIRFKDASYAQALRSMNLPQRNYFVKLMGSVNSWLRAAFTSRNPEFILSNFSRDIQSAIFNASAEAEMEGGFLNGTGAMRRIFKMVGPTLKALIRDEVGKDADPMISKYYEEFKADGGKTGWAYQKSLEDIASDLQIDDSGQTNAQKVIGSVKGALEFVEGMNDAFENSIRLSAYIAAREGGVSREKAAQFAKNITVNFNKQGEWGASVNATYLFFNASVQGSARIARSLVGLKPPIAPDGSMRNWRQRATTAQKAALAMIISSGMLTLLNRASSDEDEDGELFYNKIPDYVKERNLIIMRPDGENYWKIPMPYGYNIFANIGSTSVEVASGDKEATEGLMFMAMSMVNAFSPISFGQSDNLGTQIAKTSIPTAFKPFFEAFAFNETYFGGPVKAEQYPFGTPKPNSSMSFRSPEEIKQFFSWMNEATGGSEDVPGVVDVNPDGAWYIFEYFLGGTGRFVTRSIETGRKIVADRSENPIDLDFNDIPFMRILYGEPSKYYDMQKFKDSEVEIKQLAKEYKENRIPNAGDRYQGVNTLNEYLKKINKSLKVIRAQKRAAKKISNYGERVSRVQELMDQERKLVMMFNKKYEEIRGKN